MLTVVIILAVLMVAGFIYLGMEVDKTNNRLDELIKQFKPTETPVVEETTEKEEVPLREYRNYTKEELVSILTPEGIENILNLMKRLEELDQNPTKRKIGI